MMLAACGSQPPREVERDAPSAARPAPQKPPQYVLKRGGGYYQDDGPADSLPENLDAIPDAR